MAVAEIEDLPLDDGPLDFVEIDGLQDEFIEDGPWVFDEDDWLLYALITDPVYMPEMLWKDPKNREYAGCYRVRDYQYQLNRETHNYAIFACARSVGKTESAKIHAQIHGFDGEGEGENLLITAPELIHLLPLTDEIENNIRDSRLSTACLDTRGGQSQPLDALVLTPDGWIPMGDLTIGSRVIGSDGWPTDVTGVFPQGPRPIYTMTFTDGSQTRCDDRHLWQVQSALQRRRGIPPSVCSLQLIRELLDMPGSHQGATANRWHTPIVGPVHLRRRRRPSLDPYLLGALLGDGGLSHPTCVRFSSIDQEILDRVEAALPGGMQLTHEDRCNYRLTAGGRGKGHRNPLMTKLRALGLLGHRSESKFVPDEFLYGSINDRLELLRGLVDTDGHINDKGAVEFTTTSPHLAADIHFLVCSLGGWCRRTGRPRGRHQYQYRLKFRLPPGTPASWISRKRRRERDSQCAPTRSIADVTFWGVAEAQCISVANDDGLYVTDDFVVTHNTGFTHRPFGVNWIDGTKLVGRIPKVTGTGVKGQHQRKLIVEEGQDYPAKGWIEVDATVNYDSRDHAGEESFRFWVYGVHSGDKASGFDEKARSTVWAKIQVTALMRPDWNKARKQNAIAAYGGTSSPDYRRNILGEPGAGASKYFVTARVMSCVDQQVERPPDQVGSHYNVHEYVAQTFRAEEIDDLSMSIADLLDLPAPESAECFWIGQDVGLTDSPTVITVWGDRMEGKKKRRVLLRMFTLERFRPKDIRKALYTIGWHLGTRIAGLGIDITGLGFPMFQDIEDDELCPPHLLEVSAGYMFNAKIATGVDKNMVTNNHGVLRDQYGNMVKAIEDPTTGETRFIVMMPFIAASTRYVRDNFDSGFYKLPFDTDVIKDILGETKQRVEKLGQRDGTVKKGDRFHILDSIRAMEMRARAEEIEAEIAMPEQQPVMDYAGGVTDGYDDAVMRAVAALQPSVNGWS